MESHVDHFYSVIILMNILLKWMVERWKTKKTKQKQAAGVRDRFAYSHFRIVVVQALFDLENHLNCADSFSWAKEIYAIAICQPYSIGMCCILLSIILIRWDEGNRTITTTTAAEAKKKNRACTRLYRMTNIGSNVFECAQWNANREYS